MMQKMDEFKVNLEDAAVTFSAEGTVNLYLPKYGDDVELDPNNHPHVYTAIAIMMSLEDPRFNEIIHEKINSILATASANPHGGCGSDGGCTGCGSKCDTIDSEETSDEE